MTALQSAVGSTASALAGVGPTLTAALEDLLAGAGSYAALLEDPVGDFCMGNAQSIENDGGGALSETGTVVGRAVSLFQANDSSLSQSQLLHVLRPPEIMPTFGDEGLSLPGAPAPAPVVPPPWEPAPPALPSPPFEPLSPFEPASPFNLTPRAPAP